MTTTTPARDRLHAFYAAHPDVENSDGARLLALPKTLLDELDELLAAACAEKTPPMRVIDVRTAKTPRDDKGRFLPTFTLTYEAILSGGEIVQFVRKLTADGVEHLGRAITAIDFDDPRINNVGVTNKAGNDVTFDFDCFRAGHASGNSAAHQAAALRLLTFIPPAAA